MSRTATYETMLAELAGELDVMERKVFDALRRNPQGLTRPQLVAIVFNQTTRNVVVNTSTQDRKVRKAIESLRMRGVPIMSNSGQAGYRLDASDEARRKMLSELIARRDALTDQINQLSRVMCVPAVYPEREAVQDSLF